MTTTPRMTLEEVERRRRAFAAALRALPRARERYHNPAPELPAAKLEGCEVLANRFALLDKVPRHGVIAEIGVEPGRDVVGPPRLGVAAGRVEGEETRRKPLGPARQQGHP